MRCRLPDFDKRIRAKYFDLVNRPRPRPVRTQFHGVFAPVLEVRVSNILPAIRSACHLVFLRREFPIGITWLAEDVRTIFNRSRRFLRVRSPDDPYFPCLIYTVADSTISHNISTVIMRRRFVMTDHLFTGKWRLHKPCRSRQFVVVLLGSVCAAHQQIPVARLGLLSNRVCQPARHNEKRAHYRGKCQLCPHGMESLR